MNIMIDDVRIQLSTDSSRLIQPVGNAVSGMQFRTFDDSLGYFADARVLSSDWFQIANKSQVKSHSRYVMHAIG